MIAWLRGRLHFFAPIALVGALFALGLDWILSAPTRQESLVYAVLAFGGLGLLALKWSVLKRKAKKDSEDGH